MTGKYVISKELILVLIMILVILVSCSIMQSNEANNPPDNPYSIDEANYYDNKYGGFEPYDGR